MDAIAPFPHLLPSARLCHRQVLERHERRGPPNTDFIIYNIPQLAGVALTVPLLKEMLKNPRVIGVKNSSMPVQDIQMLKDEGTRGGRPFVVFNGPDEQLISGLVMGADGGIGGTYAVMPELYLKIYELVKGRRPGHGQTGAIRCGQHHLCALRRPKGNMYASIKEVLRRRENLDLGGVRGLCTTWWKRTCPRSTSVSPP